MQCTVVRNAKREAAGRVQHDQDSRGAQQAMVQSCRWLFEEMRRDGIVPDTAGWREGSPRGTAPCSATALPRTASPTGVQDSN
jgi:hypothetical protein